MFTQANTRSETERFDLEVRKLQSICEMHDVPFGSPSDFPGFMRKLAGDRHFAMDFWAFIGTLSSREQGELTDKQTLSFVVECVTGGEIPDDNPKLKSLAGDLGNLLAGIDVPASAVPAQIEPAPFARPESRPPAVSESWAKLAEDGGKVQLISHDPSAGSVSNLGAVSGAGEPDALASTAGLPPRVDEALLQVESKSVELKRYMDEVEAKLSKLEPRLEELAAMVAASKGQVPTPPEKRSYAANDDLNLKPSTGSRLVLEPAAPLHANSYDSFSSDGPVPLESYSQRTVNRGLVWFVVLLALAIGGFFMRGYVAPLQLKERASALIEKMRGDGAKDNATTDATTDATKASATSTGQSGAQEPAAAAPTPSVAAATPPPAGTATAKPSDAATARTSTVPPGTSEAESARSDLHARTRPVPTRPELVEEPETPLTPDQANAVRVPASVMQSNLVVSRLAVYPDLARANHVEGSVVVETIISKGGMVDHVHAIKGDPTLRSAAEEAVRRWRYRPYVVNGVPVEVATTATVDFKLNR